MYLCTKGLFWKKCSFIDCGVLYFSEMRWFGEHFEPTTYRSVMVIGSLAHSIYIGISLQSVPFLLCAIQIFALYKLTQLWRLLYSTVCHHVGYCIGRGQLKCDGTPQKPHFVFRGNERVYLNRGDVSSVDYWQPRCAHQLLLLLVMLDTPCSEVVWRLLATHSIRQFPFHFPSRPSPCAIIFHLESTKLSEVASTSALRV